MNPFIRKISAGAGAIAAFAALLAGPACGGDACTTLADEFAMCGGTTSVATTGTSSGGMPQTCTDKEKREAQCVLDARVNGQPLDLCKIKSKMANGSAEQMAYDTCYSM